LTGALHDLCPVHIVEKVKFNFVNRRQSRWYFRQSQTSVHTGDKVEFDTFDKVERLLHFLVTKSCTYWKTTDMNINESHDDDKQYLLTSLQSCDKMVDDNDAVVAVASTIIIASAVRRRHRHRWSCWVHNWMLRRLQYGIYAVLVTDIIRLNNQKTYGNFCGKDI